MNCSTLNIKQTSHNEYNHIILEVSIQYNLPGFSYTILITIKKMLNRLDAFDPMNIMFPTFRGGENATMYVLLNKQTEMVLITMRQCDLVLQFPLWSKEVIHR